MAEAPFTSDDATANSMIDLMRVCARFGRPRRL
jgi:hypothetical protein